MIVISTARNTPNRSVDSVSDSVELAPLDSVYARSAGAYDRPAPSTNGLLPSPKCRYAPGDSTCAKLTLLATSAVAPCSETLVRRDQVTWPTSTSETKRPNEPLPLQRGVERSTPTGAN